MKKLLFGISRIVWCTAEYLEAFGDWIEDRCWVVKAHQDDFGTCLRRVRGQVELGDTQAIDIHELEMTG